MHACTHFVEENKHPIQTPRQKKCNCDKVQSATCSVARDAFECMQQELKTVLCTIHWMHHCGVCHLLNTRVADHAILAPWTALQN